jgi:hypothetical protein
MDINKTKDSGFNLGYERLFVFFSLPDGWFNCGTEAFTVQVDSQIKRSGRYAVRIESLGQPSTEDFSIIARLLPPIYEGESITLKAFMKTASETEQIGLLLRVDGENNEVLQASTTTQRGETDSNGWTEYSITLPLPEQASVIIIGAQLMSSGAVWVDDFQVLIDGVDISIAPIIGQPHEEKELTTPLIYTLPTPALDGKISVERALSRRRSWRNFQDTALSVNQLSQILWSAYGVTSPIPEREDLRGGLRTAPSAGARYPFEIYVAIGNVE